MPVADHEGSHRQDGEVARGEAPAQAEAGKSCPVCAAKYPADTRFCPIDGATLRLIASATALVGRVIDDRYFLVEKVGEGGMGEVFLGEHVRTRRRCAVKVVKRKHSNDLEARERFLREATNAGRISHAHVATVYDFGETKDGLPYLAMEYVEGESLSSLVQREGPLTAARTVAIAAQITAAVDAAHDLGIVHRDLKPSNVLVGTDKRGGDLVKVVDFGIARATSETQQQLTRTGFIVGTPEFMSPEQMTGDPVDGRSDIYSLGCILYQMLTGEQAFGGPTAEVLKRRLTERPPHPRDKNPSIPKKLDEVIVTALARSPDDRYQSMDELRAALQSAVAEPTTGSRPRWTSWLGQKLRSANGPSTDPGAAVTDPGAQPSTGGAPAVTPAPAPVAFGASEVLGRATVGANGVAAEPAASPAVATVPAADPTTAGVAAETMAPATRFAAAAAALWQRLARPWQREPRDPSAEPAPPFWSRLSWGQAATADADAEAADPPTWRRRMAALWSMPAAPADGEPLPLWRRARRPIIGGVAAVALVLLTIPFVIDDGPRAETTTAVMFALAPLERRVPDDADLEAIWAELGRAKIESDGLRFDPAIGILRSTESQVNALAAAFPGSEAVRLLVDSVGARLAETMRQCIFLRDSVALSFDHRCEGND